MEILTDKNFKEKTQNGVVLVDFFFFFFGPCRMLAPTLEKLSENYKDKIHFYKVDVDQAELLARSFGILSIPTLIIFKDGKQVDKKIGFMSETDLAEWLEKWL